MLREHDLAAWVAAQLADLDRVAAGSRPRSTIPAMATTAAPELVSVNPATLEPVGAVRRTDPARLPHVVAAARAAQEQWRLSGTDARARVLRGRRAGRARARRRDRRLDRRRDGEAAHRGDRERALHGCRSCALACEARAAHARRRARALLAAASEDEEGVARVRAARRRRGDHAVEHPVRDSRSAKSRPRSPPGTPSS